LCSYDECIKTPLLIRYPAATRRTEPRLVSNVDLAPTIVELAGAEATVPPDGRSLVPLLNATPPSFWRSALLLHWKGNAADPVTGYWAARTFNYLYSELASGEQELYDLTGRNGPPDPHQLDNRAADPAYGTIKSELQRHLTTLRSP